MTKRTVITLAVLAVIFSVFSGHYFFSPAGSHQDGTSDSLKILTIGTADSGGTMSPVGKAISQVIGASDSSIKVNVSASSGSISNVFALQNKEIDLGLVSADAALSAAEGTGEFKEQPAKNLRVISAVYSSLSNWIAPSSLNIAYVHGLKGKRIGIGPKDSTTELSSKIILGTSGINAKNSTLKNCGLGSGAEEVQNNTLDAVHAFAGIPIQGLTELANTIPCTVLEFSDEELDKILRENPFYYQDIIPAGTYKGQENDVKTFGIKCLLCVDADMDEDLVYELTSILYENTDTLSEKHPSLAAMQKEGFMYEYLPIPLHPGAERYYWENGLLSGEKGTFQ